MHGFVKHSLAALVFAGFVGQAALPAAAGEIQNRINMQQSRINGGETTHHGYVQDQRHLNAIRRERNRDLRRNGGYLTPHERARINRQLNHNSARIYRSKHD